MKWKKNQWKFTAKQKWNEKNEKSLKFVLCYNLLKILLKRKNHVGGNFSQMMRIISNEREKSQSIIACSLRTIFQIFNTISSGKNGGRRGEGELQPSATQGGAGVSNSYYGEGWEVLLQKIVHLKILILHAKERKFEKFTIHRLIIKDRRKWSIIKKLTRAPFSLDSFPVGRN